MILCCLFLVMCCLFLLVLACARCFGDVLFLSRVLCVVGCLTFFFVFVAVVL